MNGALELDLHEIQTAHSFLVSSQLHSSTVRSRELCLQLEDLSLQLVTDVGKCLTMERSKRDDKDLERISEIHW